MKAAQQQHHETARGFAGLNPRANTNPPCPICGGPSWKDGFKRGKQNYYCKAKCGAFIERPASDNPYCITCRVQMHKRGSYRGARIYKCRRCHKCYYTHRRRPYRRTITARQSAALVELIGRALPYALPNREDVAQEMALAALTGDLDLSDLARMVPVYRRKVNRQSTNWYSFVSLSQPIADGLTIGDTLAG